MRRVLSWIWNASIFTVKWIVIVVGVLICIVILAFIVLVLTISTGGF